jgi:voltage-gated potassium channel
MRLNFSRIWSTSLTILALAFLVAFSWPAFEANPSEQTSSILNGIQWLSWIAFAIDLVFGLFRAEDKKDFIRRHPLEILAVALPMLRPLRIVRVISFGSMVFEKVAIGKSLGILIRLLVITLFLGYISAIQITMIEREQSGANILNFWDGLWWAFTTITTVGYGDKYPISGEGRILAVFLMVLGISLLGVVTATIAAWFVRIMQDETSAK